MARRRSGSGPIFAFVDGIFLLPLVLPPTVVGFFALLLFFGRNGPLGKLLLHFGATIVFSWPATVIAAAVVAFPLMYLTARAALEQVDSHFLQAARTLGASEWRVFREVALPLAWPGVLAGTILSFARALGEFGATLMLAGNIPGRTATIPIAIYFAVEADDIQHGHRLVPDRRADFAGAAGGAVLLDDSQAPGRARGLGADVPIEVHIRRAAGFTLGCVVLVRQPPLSILGSSGAGKSMLLRCIAGLEQPDLGRIVLNDGTLLDTEKHIQLPPESGECACSFSITRSFPIKRWRENIEFGLRLSSANERSRSEARPARTRARLWRWRTVTR